MHPCRRCHRSAHPSPSRSPNWFRDDLPMQVAVAQSESCPRVDIGDTSWMLTSARLVLPMTPGLALFYGGMVRSKNVLSTIMYSMAAISLVTVLWALVGYSLAFSPGNPFVAGLVAITPASGFVSHMSAILIGLNVAPVSFAALRLKTRLGYDDAPDVFGVHCVGGIWGALATGLLASKAVNDGGGNGLFFGGGIELFGKQVAGVSVALVFSIVGTLITGGVLKAAMGLWASSIEEHAGLDLTQHGEAAYAGPVAGSEAAGSRTAATPSGGL